MTEREHECVFVEEQEPSGRLILPPCIVCGTTAMDALAQLRETLDALQAENERLRALLEEAKGFLASGGRSQATAELVEDIHQALAAAPTEGKPLL